MIIDVHTHPYESQAVFPKAYLERIYQFKKAQMGEEAAKERSQLDGSVEALIRDMDEAGVDISVISPLDYSMLYKEEPEISIWRANEYMAEAQEKYPDRIIAFAGVDPLRRDAIELLEKGVTEWGLKGVKILLNCSLTDEAVQPFMSKVNDLEIPALIHQGASPPPFAAKYGNPVNLEMLTNRYPKMKVVAAHLAAGYESLLLAIMRFKVKTIYADLAYIQYETWQSPWYFIMLMRLFMDKIPNSVAMGSDWPLLKSPPQPTHKQWFDTIRNLKVPEQCLQLGLGIKDFSQEEKDRILGENAREWLNI